MIWLLPLVSWSVNHAKVVPVSIAKQSISAIMLVSSALLVIFEFDEVPDMDTAEMIKGRVIYAAREDIPVEPGSVFISDMLGLPVIDANTGKIYGTLKDVNNLGASDLYVVTTPSGERMLPAVAEFVDRIDLEQGIFVTPIPGLLEDESTEKTVGKDGKRV